MNIGNYPFKSFETEYSNLDGNEEEIIEFGTIQEYLFPVNIPISTPNFDLFQFAITYHNRLKVTLLNSANEILYEPEINTDVLINTFIWQLLTESSYKIILRNLGNENINYKYSVYSQKKTTELKGYINHNGGDLFPYVEENKNKNQLGVINPIEGNKINKVSYFIPDGVNISELDPYQSLLTILNVYYTYDTYTINVSDNDYYEIGLILSDNIEVQLNILKNNELVYEPILNLNKQGYFQHFTWYLTQGKYTVNFQLINSDTSCNIDLYIHKGANPINEGNESHYPEWNFMENRPIADFKDFSKLPPNGETLLAYKNNSILPIYNPTIKYLEETGKYYDFTINEETCTIAISRVFADETSGYIHYKNGDRKVLFCNNTG
jgi:hypothetical protein